MSVLDRNAVEAAAARLRGKIHRTPVVTSRSLDERAGARLFFKCESLQRTGAFKIRGATNAIQTLGAEARARGVITHSSGNHGQALALAAREAGVAATVVMPRDTARVKLAAVEAYGAKVVFCEPGTQNREAAVAALIAATGAHLVHPYDDEHVIAGQGTAALELLSEVPDLDAVIAPVGGGGLLAGTALAVDRRCAVFGAEPAQADDAARSLAAGEIVSIASVSTVADGLRSSSVGRLNFPVLRERVRAIYTVSEDEIMAAWHLFSERTKVVIEPSSAVAVAVLIRYRDVFGGKRVGVIISGGNVDLSAFAM